MGERGEWRGERKKKKGGKKKMARNEIRWRVKKKKRERERGKKTYT